MSDSYFYRTYLRSISLVCSLYLLLERWIFRVIKTCFCKFATSSICAFLLLLCLGLFSSGTVLAQDEPGEGEEKTHAQSESHKWKGIDVTTVLGNDDYAPNPGQLNTFSPRINKYPFEKGKIIFLYNVGTGMFLIEGGNWGMEGRLFHESFGRPLYLFSDGYILSGIKEKTDPTNTKFIFGCNIPSVFHSQQNWNNWDKYSFTLMMDADISRRTKGWQFKRVEGETGDTYTYYMYEEKRVNNKDVQYYLGAAYGECHASAWKGDGPLVFMDDDRAAWTTYNPQNDTTKKEVNGEEIPLNELYQWRVISEEQFYAVLEEEVTGLNPSIAALIPDRDFTRNAELFDTNWVMEEKADADYSQKGRWGYTFGRYLNNEEQNNGTYPTEAWNKPVRLKNVFEGDLAYGWQNAKYGFLSFEGVGRTYTEFEVPRPGWYMVQCYGFIQSDANDAYIFARVKGNTSEGSDSKKNLVKVPSGTFKAKNQKANCLDVGKVLTRPDGDKENYKNTVWILVTDEQFNSGLKTLQVGVGKDAATKSTNKKNNCYYDTDWVCVDDFRASYLGLGPCFFYEDEEDLEYLRFDEQNIKQYPSAVPNGRYSGATCLERTLMKNQWNSFSFPLPLTGEQVRSAFGEDAQLAYIHSIGKLSQNPNVIDFKTLSLFTTEAVVEPGQFYLLKPTKEPTVGIDPRGNETTYYELGRMFFSVNEEEPAEYTHDRMSLNTWKAVGETISSLDGEHDGNAYVNYVQTPGFSSFSVTNGEYNGDDTHGIYASMGAYVVSNNSENSTTIYHLNKDTRLKGFRGWIVLENPIGPSEALTMSIHNRFNGGKEDTSVESLPMVVTQLSADTEVYDLCGRKVGVLGTSLPKGIYLVNGKKYFVK